MKTKANNRANHYVEIEDRHIKARYGRSLTDEEKQIAIDAYKRGYIDAIQEAKNAVLFSRDKYVIEAIKELEG